VLALKIAALWQFEACKQLRSSERMKQNCCYPKANIELASLDCKSLSQLFSEGL